MWIADGIDADVDEFWLGEKAKKDFHSSEGDRRAYRRCVKHVDRM
jgi:hypothetical protein